MSLIPIWLSNLCLSFPGTYRTGPYKKGYKHDPKYWILNTNTNNLEGRIIGILLPVTSVGVILKYFSQFPSFVSWSERRVSLRKWFGWTGNRVKEHRSTTNSEVLLYREKCSDTRKRQDIYSRFCDTLLFERETPRRGSPRRIVILMGSIDQTSRVVPRLNMFIRQRYRTTKVEGLDLVSYWG